MQMKPIGTVSTCFTEKFGVPRQAGMIQNAWGTIRIEREFAPPESEKHLEAFSHLWVLFVFDRAKTPFHPGRWSATVTPPGEKAPEKVGLYASRSPHRPNAIGMSAVKLEKIRRAPEGSLEIDVTGVDLLDGTPVLDIKPYVPYADRIDAATNGWAEAVHPKYKVRMSQTVAAELDRISHGEAFRERPFRALVQEVLESDPRPRSQKEDAPMDRASSAGRRFAFRMLGLDFHWRILSGEMIELEKIVPIDRDQSL